LYSQSGACDFLPYRKSLGYLSAIFRSGEEITGMTKTGQVLAVRRSRGSITARISMGGNPSF
jgi:hypothetical protein